MPSINLSQSGQQATLDQRSKIFDAHFVLSFGIIGLAFAVLFGLKLYVSTLEQDSVAMDASIQTATQKLEGDEVDRVADFQTRLNFIGQDLDVNKALNDALIQVEGSLVAGVRLTRYNFDPEKDGLQIEAVTDNFKNIALQIVSLKMKGGFPSVSVTNTKRDEAGVIHFTLLLAS